MSGYKCYGFFKTCEIDICVDMPVGVSDGSVPVPPLSTWRHCNDFTSHTKIISKACVYDQQLYDSTSGHLGYVIVRGLI